MKKIFISFIFALTASIILSSVTFAKECDSLYSDVLRLHILANSDSNIDQELKIKVRDKILSLSNTLFYDGKEGIIKAEKSVVENMKRIEKITQEFVREQGFDYIIKCELVNMYFTTREYEDFTLPAGNYDTLRITIGKGEGKNWWCVLYPPLCLPTAIKNENMDAFFSKEQINIIKGNSKYKYKFVILELYNKLLSIFD